MDTSSIIQVRRGSVPKANIREVYAELSKLVAQGRLVFPRRVVGELEEWDNPNSAPDLPLQWARTNEAEAVRFNPPLDYWKRAMTEVPDVIDPDKTGEDEADPHVLALAVYLTEQGH